MNLSRGGPAWADINRLLLKAIEHEHLAQMEEKEPDQIIRRHNREQALRDFHKSLEIAVPNSQS